MLARWSILRWSLVLLILLTGLGWIGGCERAWLPCGVLDRWFGDSGCIASIREYVLPPHSLTVTPDGDVLLATDTSCTTYRRAGSSLFIASREGGTECKRNVSATGCCNFKEVSPDGRYVARVENSGQMGAVPSQ